MSSPLIRVYIFDRASLCLLTAERLSVSDRHFELLCSCSASVSGVAITAVELWRDTCLIFCHSLEGAIHDMRITIVKSGNHHCHTVTPESLVLEASRQFM